MNTKVLIFTTLLPAGECFAFNLVYSGSFLSEVEMTETGVDFMRFHQENSLAKKWRKLARKSQVRTHWKKIEERWITYCLSAMFFFKDGLLRWGFCMPKLFFFLTKTWKSENECVS